MKGVVVHAVLALLGLTFAYTTWTRKDRVVPPEGSIKVFDCDVNNLSAVEFEQAASVVRIESKKQDGESFVWFKKTDKPPKPKKGKDGKPVAAPKPKAKKPSYFVGNKAASELLDVLAPFEAIRSLGKVKPGSDMDEDLGLKGADKTLTVICGSRKASFLVGGSTFGAGDRYIRRKKTTEVYLMRAQTVRDLESASSRFTQRKYVRSALTDLDGIRIEADVLGKRELRQRNRADKAKAQWVNAAEPGKRNEIYGNWLSRVLRLSVDSYLPFGKQPGSDLKSAKALAAAKPFLTLSFQADGRETDRVELVKVPDPKDESKQVYYAKSGATRTWTRAVQSVAKQIDGDLPSVYGQGEPKSDQKATKKPAAPSAAPTSTPAAPHAGHGHAH